MVSKRVRGIKLVFVAIGLAVLIVTIFPSANLEETLDYKNMKFEIGETKNNLPTPYKEGTPQDLKTNGERINNG